MTTALSKIHWFIITADSDAVETAAVFGFEISFDLYTLEEQALRCIETSESDYPLKQYLIQQERKSLCTCVTKPNY